MKLLHHSQGYSQYTFIQKHRIRHVEVTVNQTGAGLINVDCGGATRAAAPACVHLSQPVSEGRGRGTRCWVMGYGALLGD